MDIVDVLRMKNGFVSLIGASEGAILESEKLLKVKFAKDYHTYVETFGSASYCGHEFTGVCNFSALSVVLITQQERLVNKEIPAEWYVIEQTHIDGILFWQDEKGSIYKSIPKTKPIKVADSLLDYIELF